MTKRTYHKLTNAETYRVFSYAEAHKDQLTGLTIAQAVEHFNSYCHLKVPETTVRSVYAEFEINFSSVRGPNVQKLKHLQNQIRTLANAVQELYDITEVKTPSGVIEILKSLNTI